MKYTDVIWDYNGTIIDDVAAGIASVNKLLSDRGMKTIGSTGEYRSVFTFPVIDYYKKLGFDFEKESFDVISKQWVAEYCENFKSCTLRCDVVDTIEKISRLGIGQSVISASDDSMLKSQLASHGIIDLFGEVCGLDGIKAESKICVARAWRERHPDARPVFVGDTLHDLDAAREIGADCVLICGGHQSEEILLSSSERVIRCASELLEILK